ncbi:MAG: YciI family protein [Pseudomonadales bacterium]
MLFMFSAQDVPNSLAKRLAARPDHLARLAELDKAGRLVLAGPHPNQYGEGFTGSLIVAEFDDLQAAEAWAQADPYQLTGVYESMLIKPFKQVFPDA